MADPTEDPAPAALPAIPPVPASDTVAAPVQADPASSAAAVAPAADSQPAAGAESPKPVEPAKPEASVAEPTLLEKFDAEKAKGAEAAKPGDPDKPVETAPAPELPKLDYFKDVKIPETIRLDDAQRGDVTAALDALRGGKTAEGVQKLFDLHDKTMQAYAEQLSRDQWATFNETRKVWRTQVMADPVLGGAGHNTAMGAIARMRDLAVSDAKAGTKEYEAQRAQFDEMLRVTGAGDHPAFLRFVHNFARFFDEPALPPEGARPPPNPGHPAGESRKARMYPSMNGQRT